MKLIIDRKKWLRGDKNSYLLRSKDLKMCCLGFYLNECGISKRKLKSQTDPSYITKHIPEKAQWLICSREDICSPICCELMNINDHEENRGIIREQKITKIFKEHGVNVKFIN